jgi:hypothetical protein
MSTLSLAVPTYPARWPRDQPGDASPEALRRVADRAVHHAGRRRGGSRAGASDRRRQVCAVSIRSLSPWQVSLGPRLRALGRICRSDKPIDRAVRELESAGQPEAARRRKHSNAWLGRRSESLRRIRTRSNTQDENVSGRDKIIIRLKDADVRRSCLTRKAQNIPKPAWRGKPLKEV